MSTVHSQVILDKSKILFCFNISNIYSSNSVIGNVDTARWKIETLFIQCLCVCKLLFCFYMRNLLNSCYDQSVIDCTVYGCQQNVIIYSRKILKHYFCCCCSISKMAIHYCKCLFSKRSSKACHSRPQLVLCIYSFNIFYVILVFQAS